MTTVRVRLFIAAKLCDEVKLDLGADMTELLGQIGRATATW